MEAVWISTPSPCARMKGSATVTQYIALLRLPRTSSSTPSVDSTDQRRGVMFNPALFTRISSRPKRLAMKAPMAFTAAASIRSAGWTSATPPIAAMRDATESSGARRRPVRISVAPSSANLSAAASPIPLPAPVTQATLPSSRFIAAVLPLSVTTA